MSCAALRRAAQRNEIWEKFIFHCAAFFRRCSVANRKKTHALLLLGLRLLNVARRGTAQRLVGP